MKVQPKSGKMPVLTILVPVYNEEKTIKSILDRVCRLPIDNYEVIIVNDASHDKSAQIIDAFIAKNKTLDTRVVVITHEKNKGKGATIQTALKSAKGRYFVIQDADLEYDPADIPPLLKAAVDGNRPVVYGSRFMGNFQGMPKPNYYANCFYNFLLRRLYETKVTDMHTCYKMIKIELLKEFSITSDGFDYATEVVSNILKRRLEIYELPISFKGRTRVEGKKIGYKDGLDCTYQIFKYRFSKNI